MTDEINTSDLGELSALWITAKQTEANSIAQRRKIEDHIKELIKFNEREEGTETFDNEEFVIKIVGRIDRKVDAEKVQELAAEFGLTDHLSSLFRWKPEVNLSAWKAASESITKHLAAAITSKPGRASFTITKKE